MVIWNLVGFSIESGHFYSKSSVSSGLLTRAISAQAVQSPGVMGTLLSRALDEYRLCIHSFHNCSLSVSNVSDTVLGRRDFQRNLKIG